MRSHLFLAALVLVPTLALTTGCGGGPKVTRTENRPSKPASRSP